MRPRSADTLKKEFEPRMDANGEEDLNLETFPVSRYEFMILNFLMGMALGKRRHG
jgi:hypothetical protein